MEKIEENKLITLKEASQLCGYSADYIGQLIRAGKIPGRQVYSNVQWMTTAEAVIEYKKKGKNGNNNGLGERITRGQRKLVMEFNVLRLFFATFKSALPLLLSLIAIFIILVSYLLFAIFAKKTDMPVQAIDTQKSDELVF